MTQSRPFTLIAAAIFLAMTLVHAYRLATHFQVMIGSHVIPIGVSWIGMLLTAALAVLLFREARR